MHLWEERLLKISERYDILDIMYTNNSVCATVMCKVCKKVRTVRIGQLYGENMCPNCNRLQKLKEKQKEFVEKMNVINPNIEFLSEYQGVNKKNLLQM